MVDLSGVLGLEAEEDAAADIAQDFAALKDCLQALADAVACTNLAVLASGHGDAQAAAQRVNGSVSALKRFSTAFALLDTLEETAEAGRQDEEDA